MDDIKYKIRTKVIKLILWNYRNFYTPLKVYQIRRKPVITVAFLVHSLGAWKSEMLYKKMLEHPRFNPYILILKVEEEDDRNNLKNYLDSKGYLYTDITEKKSIRSIIKPDIIFYQKPYRASVPVRFGFKRNLASLFCYINYGFHGTDSWWSRNTEYLNNCWQIYFENQIAMSGSKKIMDNKCKNGVISGLPIMDEFLIPKIELYDPWRNKLNKKKRIIWAPHHSISHNELLNVSTFLKYSDFMINMAEKYRDYVQWAFKPHPLLRNKVQSIWGKEKTDDYWKKWDSFDNTQGFYGKYLGLFKYSDAMIHDSGSFTIEYLYTCNPVMFIVKNDNVTNGFNEFQQKAFDLHVKGFNEDDIESFIKSIISSELYNEDERKDFYHNYLLPPYGSSSTENIIKSILGETL